MFYSSEEKWLTKEYLKQGCVVRPVTDLARLDHMPLLVFADMVMITKGILIGRRYSVGAIRP